MCVFVCVCEYCVLFVYVVVLGVCWVAFVCVLCFVVCCRAFSSLAFVYYGYPAWFNVFLLCLLLVGMPIVCYCLRFVLFL